MEAKKNYGAVSVYQNFRCFGVEDLTNLLLAIRSDKHQSKINSIRYALHKGDEESAETLKKELDAFTASGIFEGGRSQANLKSHSGFVCLDFDDIPREELDNVKSKVCSSPFTFGAFISPTCTGIKVLVKVEPDNSNHLETYVAVSKFYEALVGHECDPKCKDITRLCFVSHDEDCHINPDATTFIPTPKNDSKLANNDQLPEEALEKCLKFTERQNEYRKGNRNNFIFQFASNANRWGISVEHTRDFCVSTFDLGEKEITDTVKSVYHNHFAEFAKFANSVNFDDGMSDSGTEFTVEQCTCSTPLIPEWIYSTLP
ncbi:BT4734/BF3469 family protein [Flavobacterium caeni]|uniref:VirE N-terminal domain-containing protein n=1 Tax=Flavobacterium caeni TaxID=490189 RepID=A0A1G5JWA3_9FLAO|nr:BT4734/BF3469 family protein [Flavobacterium caeni]SCY92732.1 VirE N-terminal domain-containing protein [Flavobacterium caeni]